jgi:hypothetical protein
MSERERFDADPFELVATGDVAERAGVTRNAIAQWIRRYPTEVPIPVAQTSAGPIYLWEDWEAWLRRTGRIRE